MKKLLTFLILFFLLSSQVFPQIMEITADTISEDTTWSGTVRITKDLTIALGTNVNINPGTVVEFQGYYMINLRGSIKALGTPEDSILFTRPDTSGFHDLDSEAGGWNGIRMDNYDYQMGQSDTSVFRFCKFEHSKSIVIDGAFAGVFTIRFTGQIILDNCVFRNNATRTNGGAIFIENDVDPMIFNCSFMNNSANSGGAVFFGYKARSVLYSCLFYENRAFEGGAIFSAYARGAILNCIFCNNAATNTGGAMQTDNSRDKIIGNLIANNEATGAGGGIKFNDSWPELNNNTICYNHSGWGGGLEFWGLCNADFYNNILWGNTYSPGYVPNQFIISSTTSTPNFYNCIIQDGTDSIMNDYTGKTANIITNDPCFINPSVQSGLASNGLEADFSVEPFSPAINLGSNDIKEKLLVEIDLRGNPRILHGVLDIGAYETQMGSFSAFDTIFENTTWIADTVKVNSDIVVVDSATLNIAPGTFVEFQDHYRLEVIGTIRALGSKNFPITFSVTDTAGLSNTSTNEGSWGGIVFDNSQFGANAIMNDNDSSIFRYCTFQYAKNISDDWDAPPGGAISIRYFSRLEIANCTIQYNTAFMGGGIGITMYSHPFIHNNLIYKNFALVEGGGLTISNSSSPRILNNYIFNNSAKRSPEGAFGGGIRIIYADPILINNVICNNYAEHGGGLDLDDARPLFSNNTVCNNMATMEAGGMKMYKSTPDIFNSIFWGNSSPVIEGRHNQVYPIENVNFYHNNIQGGKESVTPWWQPEYQGGYEGNIDDNPEFKNPTKGPGPGFDALTADWSITDYSANINKGHPESQHMFTLPDKDIAGKRRINHEIIDIGAFENQGEPLFIIREPHNQFACVGDTIEFSVEVEGKARFQWLKDGEEIEGADTNVLSIDSVELDDQADYICMLRNGYGLLLSNNVTLQVNAPPEILLQTESQWVKEDATLKLEIHGRGTEPIFYSWMKNGEPIPEADRPEYRIAAMGYDDEGTYLCSAGNICGETISDPITLFVAPQICMVTVDIETGDNLIVWEKKGAAPVSEYNIYRESIVAGEYEPIGNLPCDALSVFVDTGANPTLQAYIYKITAIDHDGHESDLALCKPHKTIHLLTTINVTTGATQLDWDHYYGFTYGTFHIYRSLTESNFSIIHDMSSSTTEYTDPNPGNDLFYYRISVDRPTDCVPTGESMKAGSGPYSYSLSNTEDNRLQTSAVEEVEGGKLNIYPNPLSDYTTIRFNNPENKPYRLRIIDLSGKIAKTAEVNTPEFTLFRSSLEKGYYTVELKGEKLFRGKLVIE